MAENEVSTFNPLSLMPPTFGEKYQMAQLLSKSGLIPQTLNTPEKVCVALEWGHELQLSPMVAVNNITVINGKPTLSADVMAAVVKRSPEYGGIEWIALSDKEAECVVIRKGKNYEEKTTSKFTIQDAVNAGLANRDVWKKYPKRMLKHRCLSYALRDAFPDILAVLYNPEEIESLTETETTPVERNITAEAQITMPETATVNFEEMREAMPEAPQETAYSKLYTLVNNYAAQLQKTANVPTPYEQANAVLQTQNETDCDVMYTKCVTWLGKKGIKVA